MSDQERQKVSKSVSVYLDMLEEIRECYDQHITDAEMIRAALHDAIKMQQAEVSSPAISNTVVDELSKKGGSAESVVRIQINPGQEED